MGGSFSAGKNNDELIDEQVKAGVIHTPLIEQVFRAVDRGNYYYPEDRENAYRDIAWKVGNLHLSAPTVYSDVMEALKLKPGLSFLNLGSGSGYLSTMVGLILGPYGINHGIEICHDIVDFAERKLNDFMESANAIDKFDFCEPSFFLGNCFLLDSSCQPYDRVYCGAACPEEYETYIKNLVKVGGILIMPFKEKLLKMTRTGEATWTATNLISLSFAPLITPPPLTECEHVKFINVGNFCPPKLMHLCRSNIRSVLRNNIDKDYPNLRNKQGLAEIESRRRARRNVPFFVQDDRSQGNSDSKNDSDRPECPFGPRIPAGVYFLLEDFIHKHADLQALNETEQSHSSSTDNDIKPCNDKENSREDPNKKTNSENMSNSENKTKSESSINSEKLTYSASFKSMTDDSLDSEVSKPSSSKTLTSDELKLSGNHTYHGTQIHRKKASAIQTLNKGKLQRKQPASDQDITDCEIRARVKRRAECDVRKRISPRNSDSEMEDDSKNDNIAEGKDNVKKDIEDDTIYTKNMVQKIAVLPLPYALIKYVNNNRNNL